MRRGWAIGVGLLAVSAMWGVACSDEAVEGNADGAIGADVVVPDAADFGTITPDVPDGDAATAPDDAPVVADVDGGPVPDAVPDVVPDGPPDIPVTPDIPVQPTKCGAMRCEIGEVCRDDGAPNPFNPCEACVALVDPHGWTPDDTASCDDDDVCTDGDHCADGVCAGFAKVCDDANPCTDSGCNPLNGDCVFTQNQAPCNDGDPCSLGDACKYGKCQPGKTKMVCEDDNTCTVEACIAMQGCVFQGQTGPLCDDGDPCTTGDYCVDGACAGALVGCDDFNICTIDYCDPANGSCAHLPINDLCADTNPCTDETCDMIQGCIYPFNDDPCDDGLICTTNDTCSGGACLGVAPGLDDNNPCTDDLCDPSGGIQHTPNTQPCDDGDACTVGDTCAGGACVSGTVDLVCDDGNPCTDDGCDSVQGCYTVPRLGSCDDGSVCTVADICSNGSCVGEAIQCQDGNACTEDSCDPAIGCVHGPVVSNACRPNITVSYPPRAATLMVAESPTLEVTGSVFSGAGPITSFKINGQSVSLGANGNFTHAMNPAFGGNMLVFAARDSLGTTRKRVQSFLWSSTYYQPGAKKSGMVPEGMGIFLAQEVLDDGSHGQPPDDLATLFEMVIQSFDIAALIPNPVVEDQAGYDITLSNLSYDPAKVTLTSTWDGVRLKAVMSDLYADVDAEGLIDVSGYLEVDAIVVNGDVVFWVDGSHNLHAELGNVNVTFNNIDVTLNPGILDWFLGWLVDWLVDIFAGDIVEAFETTISAQIGPILEDTLGDFALDLGFEVPGIDESLPPVNLNLISDFNTVDSSPAGITFRMRTGVYANPDPHPGAPYTNLGALGRGGCGGTQTLAIPEDAALELSLSDDTVNQLLYALWRGDYFEFPVPAEMLGDVDLSTYGIDSITITVSGMLAPTASDCLDIGSPVLDLHVGDLRADANMSVFGQPLDVVVFASFVAGVQLAVSGDELAVTIHEVQNAELEVNVVQDSLISMEDTIRGLLEDELIGGLMDALGGDALGGIPLPEIDIGGVLPGIPPGTVISINPQTNKRINGNTVVGGTL